MYKIKNPVLLLFILFSLFLFGCEDNPEEDMGSVSFSFDEKSNGRKRFSDIEDATAIIVSIEDELGNTVYESKQIELLNFEGSFISEPLPLLIGNYKLTEFLVINSESDVIFATPLSSSATAYLVDTPLPIDFIANEDEVTLVVPEVLATEGLSPEDLGYTTFSLNVVETFDIQLGVMVYNPDSENLELTTSIVTIEDNGGSVYSADLPAITNSIKLRNGYDTYDITIIKEGYQGYNKTFTNSELLQFSEGEPLIIILEEESFLEGLLAFYPFNNNVNDESGNGYDGTLYNASFIEDRFGQENSALNFNGTDHYVELPAIQDFPNNQISVVAWVTPNQFYSDLCHHNQIIGNLGNRNGVSEGQWYLSFAEDDGSDCNNHNPETTKFFFGSDFENGDSQRVKSNTIVDLNTRYFVVGVYDGANLKIYINGVLDNQLEVNKNLWINDSNIVIGKDVYHSQFPYNTNGDIDDIRIYNRTLTDIEIQSLYAN